jgi:putative hemolysin
MGRTVHNTCEGKHRSARRRTNRDSQREQASLAVVDFVLECQEFTVKFSIISVGVVAAAVLSVSAALAAGAGNIASQGVSPDFNPTLAAAYCVQTGGIVETRTAWYGTNGPNPLKLAGDRSFCRYKAQDGSRIHLLLDTLYTQQPTLAALAYYAQVPIGQCGGNPASCYCTLLGGSDQFGGTTGAGGGWVNLGTVDQTLEACIFPDLSSIDSWGLTYHSVGIIRGTDLSKVLRFKNPFAKKR